MTVDSTVGHLPIMHTNKVSFSHAELPTELLFLAEK